MNTSRSTRSECSVCKNNQAIGTCRGCEESFCELDFADHRRKLRTEYVGTIKKREKIDSLLENGDYFVPRKTLDDIDVWEQKMITTIQTIAAEKRKETNERIRIIHQQLRQHLCEITAQQEEKKDGVVETDLDYWNDLIDQLERNIEKLSNCVEVRTNYEIVDWHTSIRVASPDIEIPRLISPSTSAQSISTDWIVKSTLNNSLEPLANAIFDAEKSQSVRHETPRHPRTSQLQFCKTNPTDPRLIKPIERNINEPMAASERHLVVFSEKSLLIFNHALCKQTYTWSLEEKIVDMCFCSATFGYILLTETKVFKFSAVNKQHTLVTAIKPMRSRNFSHCASDGQSLWITYKFAGAPIEEWYVNDWIRITTWKSPVSCDIDDYINQIRYSLDQNKLGITLYKNGQIRFELRDHKMIRLQSVVVCDCCTGLAAMPNSQWLLSDGRCLYLINQHGKVEILERQSSSALQHDTGNIAIFGADSMVIRSLRILYFFSKKF